MKANYITKTPEPLKHTFEVVKYNKHDTIYQLCFGQPETELIKQTVKVEVYQNYSKAYNLGLYFRVKTATSWSKSKAVTGMFKTTHLNTYYGDQRTNKGKTLLLFKVDPESQTMCVYEYPKGYYPSRKVIDSLINQI
jgi:hypothetical protein